MSRKQDKSPGKFGGINIILTRRYLVVARNTTLQEVSCKVNKYSVSENTLYRYVDGFHLDRITNILGDQFCSNKMKHILTREHLLNDG